MVTEQQKVISNKIQQNTKITEAVAKNTPSKSTIELSKPLKIEQKITPQNIESAAVAQVVAQVKAIQNKQGMVTPANVDLLLSEAREKLQLERMLSSRKVDPAALLQDVESDLEESFRNKVFDALGSGYQKIRTAVVERNN
jgi:stage V sporulation protein SpoVS